MTHDCDDTAYPAAAMPAECTCDETPSEGDMAELVAAAGEEE
jgi:hypothetical protein